jgi:DNA polymerase
MTELSPLAAPPPLDPGTELLELVADLRAWAEVQRGLGAWLPSGELPRPSVEEPAAPPAVKPIAGRPSGLASPPPRLSLAEVRAELGDCTRCKLHRGRTQIVFGVGNPGADLCFVGEGPGRDEDLQGEPFVGAAGQLLTKIIENAVRLPRADVYICNVVKCRPPENRNPEPDEIAACSPFLMKQLASIRPKVIVLLGRFAAQLLLRTEVSIGRLRGRVHDWEGAGLVATYHPAYLLRNPDDKIKVFEDMKLVRAEYERRTGRALPPPLSRQQAQGGA